jgi:hypothetical protein
MCILAYRCRFYPPWPKLSWLRSIASFDQSIPKLPGGGKVAQNEVTNNLVTITTLEGKEEFEIPFKYVVQWPVNGERDVEVVLNDLY